MDDPLPCSRLLKVIVGLLPDERVIISKVKTIWFLYIMKMSLMKMLKSNR